MKIEERTIGPVVVLDMAGRLVAGESQGHLKDKINSLTMQGRLQILLNLAEVSYIDSTGLGELVSSVLDGDSTPRSDQAAEPHQKGAGSVGDLPIVDGVRDV